MRISNPVKTFRMSISIFQELEKYKDVLNVNSWNHFFKIIIDILNIGNDLRKIQQKISYENKDKWKVYGSKDSCAECGVKDKQLDRHHWLGYSGKNAFKVKMLCKICHGKSIHN